jgi:D-alanyl-D-alanine carboxypeptidase
MNLTRAIGGPLLSIVFLIFFVYMISDLQWVYESYLQKHGEVFSGSVSNSAQNITHSVQNITQKNDTGNNTQSLIVVSPRPEVNAKSAISVESNLKDINKVLFEKDVNMQLPIASLTKLMTAVIVLDNYNLSDTIVVDKIADSQDATKQDVKLGDAMPVESLLDIMIVGSSNKSAYALSEGPGGLLGEQEFVNLMNQKAKDLGLENTFFADPTGLSPKNVSTASDLTKLAEYILKNYPKIADISKVKEFYVPGFGNVINTDQLLGEIPEIICSKTGFTAAAKGCLLLVVNNPKNNDYLISVILGADDRFYEMKNLINWSSTTCN